jgi:hypothetical protein
LIILPTTLPQTHQKEIFLPFLTSELAAQFEPSNFKSLLDYSTNSADAIGHNKHIIRTNNFLPFSPCSSGGRI